MAKRAVKGVAGRLHSATVMFRPIGGPGLVVATAAIVVGLAGRAAAESTAAVVAVRGSRPVSIGFSPGGPWADGRQSGGRLTIPLPALRVGVSLSPRLAVDLTGGILPFEYTQLALVDLGARWFFTAANVSPYLMGRAGVYLVDIHDDYSAHHTYGYATLGGGVEYASGGGFTAWAEIGPVLVKGNPGAAAGAYASVGLGYRF
jgi:hypothetical protein